MIAGYGYGYGEKWVKVFSHDVTGGYFPDLESGKSYNKDSPDETLYSVLDQMEKYRRNGVFHIRICYPGIYEPEFPCNEWKQSSNMVEEDVITDYIPIRISFPESGNGGVFGGLGLTTLDFGGLIDDRPGAMGEWWYCIGCTQNFGIGFPGPHPTPVKKVELYLADGRIIFK